MLQNRMFPGDAGIFEHYYLCNYHSKSSGFDGLSMSLLRFKSGWPLEVEAWSECALVELAKLETDGRCAVVRALGSNEHRYDGRVTPLDHLGKRLSEMDMFDFCPGCIEKTKTTREIKTLTLEDRRQELNGAYRFNNDLLDSSVTTILVIDDICTSGTTLDTIAGSIRCLRPDCKIVFFTLALSTTFDTINNQVQLTGSEYHWSNGIGWTLVEESGELYGHYIALKRRILNDFDQLAETG